MLLLTLAFVQNVTVLAQSEMKTFFSKQDWPGISIRVDATTQTVPGENLTAKLWINCTADGVKVDYLNLSLYGFSGGQQKISLGAMNVLWNSSLVFNHTSEYNYTVLVPSDVWDATYMDMSLKYFIYSSPFEYSPSFSITVVRNVYYEQLKEDFNNLNASFYQLNSTYWQLNKTYWELQKNYTALQGRIGDLDSTRQLALILGITTVFFVATTLYLVIRKPKQYW
jgi:hypothetical protein